MLFPSIIKMHLVREAHGKVLINPSSGHIKGIHLMVTHWLASNDSQSGGLQQSLLAHDPGHYNDIIMGTMVSQITSLTIVYSTVYSGADQRKHQSSSSLASVTDEIPAQRVSNAENVPFDDVIMERRDTV